MDKAAQPTLTPEEHVNILIEELARREAEKLALVSEFSKATNPEEIGNKARDAIRDLLPESITTMKELLVGSGSDGVRAGIAKFVMQTALDKTKLEDETDTSIRNLLTQLGAETSTEKAKR